MDYFWMAAVAIGPPVLGPAIRLCIAQPPVAQLGRTTTAKTHGRAALSKRTASTRTAWRTMKPQRPEALRPESVLTEWASPVQVPALGPVQVSPAPGREPGRGWTPCCRCRQPAQQAAPTQLRNFASLVIPSHANYGSPQYGQTRLSHNKGESWFNRVGGEKFPHESFSRPRTQRSSPEPAAQCAGLVPPFRSGSWP